MAKQAKTIETLICPSCHGQTDHKLRDSYKTQSWDDEDDVGGGATNDFLECMGCHAPTLRINSWFSEEPERSVAYYPPRGEPSESRKPKDFDSIPFGSPLESVYRQTITAFNYKLSTLVAAGVRLLVEGTCKDRGIKGGTLVDDDGKPLLNKKTGNPIKSNSLKGQINGLVEQGYIGRRQADVLHEIRDFGNDAAHGLEQPRASLQTAAIDIVEHLLEQIYEQPERAKLLSTRKRPVKKSSTA